MAESKSRHKGGDSLASLDLREIEFPSDRITIGQLRRAFPKQFDVGFGPNDDPQPRFFFEGDRPSEVIGNILYLERLIAAEVYASIVGCDSPADPGFGLKDMKKDLAKSYVIHGVSGKHEASELVRDIERQATELGTERRSRTR